MSELNVQLFGLRHDLFTHVTYGHFHVSFPEGQFGGTDRSLVFWQACAAK